MVHYYLRFQKSFFCLFFFSFDHRSNVICIIGMSLFFVKRHVACFLINGDDNLLVVVVGLHLEFQYVPFFVIPTTNARTFFLFLHDMHDIHLWISKSYIGLPIFNTFTPFYTIIHLIPTNDCSYFCLLYQLDECREEFSTNGKTNSDCGLRFCISIPQSYRKFGGLKLLWNEQPHSITLMRAAW